MQSIGEVAYGVGKRVSSSVSPRSAALIAYRAFSDVIGKGSMFVITVVAARRLSRQAFGIFSLATTFGWLLAVATDFGIQLHVARAVARKPEEADRILGAWLKVRLTIAAAAIVLVIVGLVASPRFDPYAIPILIFAVFYLVSGLIEFLHYFYRGLDRTDVESSLTLWQRIATLGCALAVLAFAPALLSLAIAMLIPALVTFVASVAYAGSLSHARAGRVRDFRADRTFATITEFRREVLPIGAGIVLSALYFRVDVFLVDLWKGTEAVALYNAVFRLVEALRLVPAAMMAVMLPTLCRADDTRPLIHISLAATAFAAAAAILLAMMAGWLIPLVYGDRYAPAVAAFRILLLSFPLLSLNYALTHQLIGWDGEWAYALICAVALVANVALNARFIPRWSIEGAAWATLATEAVLTAGCVAALRIHVPRRLRTATGVAS